MINGCQGATTEAQNLIMDTLMRMQGSYDVAKNRCSPDCFQQALVERLGGFTFGCCLLAFVHAYSFFSTLVLSNRLEAIVRADPV